MRCVKILGNGAAYRWHGACALRAGYPRLQLHRLCNTHCFFTATGVARTRLNVTLYKQCLFYYISVPHLTCLVALVNIYRSETSRLREFSHGNQLILHNVKLRLQKLVFFPGLLPHSTWSLSGSTLSLPSLNFARPPCCVDHAGMPCNGIIFLQSFSKIGQPVKILNGAKHTREVLGEKRTSNTSNMAGLESNPGLRDNKPVTNHSSHNATLSLDSGRFPCGVGQNPNSENHADVHPFPKWNSNPQSQCLRAGITCFLFPIQRYSPWKRILSDTRKISNFRNFGPPSVMWT